MSELATYLNQRFLRTEALAAACDVSADDIENYVRQKLIPGPTYVVCEEGTIRSHLFGEFDAAGATPGFYFHPASAVWVANARNVLAGAEGPDASEFIKFRFCENFQAALAQLNRTSWRIVDCFRGDGSAIEEGLSARSESAWKHFLVGTWGLCVSNPDSAAAIAEKSVLQEKLVALSDDGKRTRYSAVELLELHDAIYAYEQVSMPFSPAEYELCSRKRLVDDLRARLKGVSGPE